jgi:hypothetical protein
VSTGTSEPQTTEERAAEPAAEAPRVRRWGLLALIAGGAIIVALLTLLVVRIVITNARPPLGVTAVADLQPGACLAEQSAELAEYTVISCSDPHPQQVIASFDLALGRDVYTSYGAIPTLAQEICDRYLEYDLYVERDAPGDDRLSMLALGVPSEAEYNDGRTLGYCAVVATDGSDLTTDEYHPVN